MNVVHLENVSLFQNRQWRVLQGPDGFILERWHKTWPGLRWLFGAGWWAQLIVKIDPDCGSHYTCWGTSGRPFYFGSLNEAKAWIRCRRRTNDAMPALDE